MPIVDCALFLNWFLVYLSSNYDLPTPESPISTILNMSSLSGVTSASVKNCLITLVYAINNY